MQIVNRIMKRKDLVSPELFARSGERYRYTG
jgi:hypothetical protein